MMPVEYDITGKVVFITGAGRGIGKGIARVLAEAGADVAINALTDKYVTGLAAELAASSGRRVLPLTGDVTQPDGARRAVESVLTTFGRIDVLVNALGDSIRKPLVTLPGTAENAPGVTDDELRFIMDINLTEALLCTRAVGPHMLARGSGKVINIASWTAQQGGKDMVIYTTAKTALAGFRRRSTITASA
jgi:2-deoxy-D-gluconate 3-dehydrogenase